MNDDDDSKDESDDEGDGIVIDRTPVARIRAVNAIKSPRSLGYLARHQPNITQHLHCFPVFCFKIFVIRCVLIE